MRNGNLFGDGVYSQHPQDALFFVATVTAGVDADGGELATLAPALDGESGNAQKSGDFGDSQQVGEVGEIDFLLASRQVFFFVVVHI